MPLPISKMHHQAAIPHKQGDCVLVPPCSETAGKVRDDHEVRNSRMFCPTFSSPCSSKALGGVRKEWGGGGGQGEWSPFLRPESQAVVTRFNNNDKSGLFFPFS